ncbi:MAG: hypothetical protein Q4E50_06445 [Tissierellia bacterium]|nr:hypothetical protein [Tissierellia bacterium]
MKFSQEDLKKYEDKILKIKLEQDKHLRGRFLEYVEKEGHIALVIQSNTYTFQIDDKDIKDVEIIAERVW